MLSFRVSMSVKRNFLTGLASSVWAAVAGIIAMPFYLKYLGADAFGMIGIHLTLQGLFMLLDMGFAPAVSREVARSLATGALEHGRAVLHSVSLIFNLLGAFAAFALVLASPGIAETWITSKSLGATEIQNSLAMSAIALGVRWPGSIYAGALNGAQRIDVVSVITIASNTLATIGAILILVWIRPTLSTFFIWQILVGAAHSLAMRSAAWRIIGRRTKSGYDWRPALSVWRFTLGVAGVAATGAVMMNLDRVVLSSTTDLENVGYYTIALAFAGLLYRITVPAFNVLYTKLSGLFEHGDDRAIREYYKNFSSIILAIVFPAGIFLCLAAKPILEIWFSDKTIVNLAWQPTVILCLATMLHCAMYFPFALQLATGNTRLPFYINLGLIAILIPLFYSLSLDYGIVGAACAWFVTHAAYLVAGTYLTGRYILSGEGMTWVWKAPIQSAAVALPVLIAATFALDHVQSDLIDIAIAVAATVVAFVFNVMLLPGLKVSIAALDAPLQEKML
jgi:O-antigen/teichoic acid export membrane protein